MGIYSPRLWWFAITLLLWAPHTHCREFTHEDIREAMLSLVHMIRMSEDKLERHELREKSLGEQLKKMLNNLDKKHRALEPLKGMISRLDDRLSNVETILLQKEEREKTSQLKITETLEGIQRGVMTLSQPRTDPASTPNVSGTNAELLKRLDATNKKIDILDEQIKGLKAVIKSDSICKQQAANENQFANLLAQAENVIKIFEAKLHTALKNATPETAPLHEVAIADQAWQCNISNVLENQVKKFTKIEDLLNNAETRLKGVPQREDFNQISNKIIGATTNLSINVISNQNSGVTSITTKLREMGDRLSTTNVDIQKSLTQSNTMTERAYNDITRSYEMLRTEVSLISKDGTMAQNISDTMLHLKKRFEYGVNQIIMQMTELVKGQSKMMDEQLRSKLEQLAAAVVSNQSLALANLSTTLESEMSQVWRQIGIMHRQIMMSQESLNHLSENSEHYVNSSSATMNKVKDEVDSIKTRMVDLGENVNYVLGKLSLVTQEFKMMAAGLHSTLQSLSTRVANVTVPEDNEIVPFPGTEENPKTDAKTTP